MRIAVVSDTHLPKGARVLPAECVERLRAADLILHAGDLVSVSFLEELRALGPPVEAVYGNVDEPVLRSLLPKERIVEIGTARIGMVHIPGPRAGREERLRARFSGCGAVVYGHTHLPQVERVDGVWILNPARRPSAARRRRGRCSSCASRRGRSLPCSSSSSLDRRTGVRYSTEHMFVRILVLAGIAVLVWSAAARSSQAHGKKQVVTVQAYGTLWSIAQRHYGGDVRDAIWRIERANHLPGADVSVGETLVLP